MFFARFICVLATVAALPLPFDASNGPNDIFALLVAGSKGWINYRHQANVAHSYHLLLSKGVPRENIVVMMYDDIIHDIKNPYPGELRNSPNGPDYYAGLQIDYKGADVTQDVFEAVLSGDTAAARGKGTGRVLNCTKSDNIFVYYADHGGNSVLSLPTGALITRRELTDMIRQTTFNKMAVYIEACESGSMLLELQNDDRVFGLTASTATEQSYATFCDYTTGICFADHFSIKWMEDSEQYDLDSHTDEEQYADVRDNVGDSHVTKFGSAAVLNIPVSHFQGKKNANRILREHQRFEFANFTRIEARNVPLFYYETMRNVGATDNERLEAELTITNIIEKRRLADVFIDSLVKHSTVNSSQRQSTLRTDDCYDTLIRTFETRCMPLGNSPYLAKLLSKLQYLHHDLGCGHLSDRLAQGCKLYLAKYELIGDIL